MDVCVSARACVRSVYSFVSFGIRAYPPLTLVAHLCLLTFFAHLCQLTVIAYLCLLILFTHLCLLTLFAHLCQLTVFLHLCLLTAFAHLCLLTVFAHLCLLTLHHWIPPTRLATTVGPSAFSVSGPSTLKTTVLALSKRNTRWTHSYPTFRHSVLFFFLFSVAFHSALLSWSAASSRLWSVVTCACIHSYARVSACARMRLEWSLWTIFSTIYITITYCWVCAIISPILYLELFIIYWLGVRNFENSKNDSYKQSFQLQQQQQQNKHVRGCTSGGVYVPGIYTHARWELT